MNPENNNIPERNGHGPELEGNQPCRHCDPFLMSQRGTEVGRRRSMPIMTDREIAVLGAMRGVKKEVSKIKRRLRLVEEDLAKPPRPKTAGNISFHETREELWRQGLAEEAASLNQRLIVLKEQWQSMDRERIEAAEERMRLLGHQQ